MGGNQMNTDKLISTAQSLVADNKGLLAIDESIGTCNKRFAAMGIPQTVEMRRSYRELIITTPRLNALAALYCTMKQSGKKRQMVHHLLMFLLM
jgi:fructose-bisphosphate aldolase class 1